MNLDESMDIPDFQPAAASGSGAQPGDLADMANTSGEEGTSSSGEEESDSEDEAPKVRVPRHRSEEVDEADVDKPVSEGLKAAMAGIQASGSAPKGGIGARTMGGIGSKARSDAMSQTLDPPPVASTSTSPAPASPAAGQEASEAPKSGMGMAAAQQRRAFLGTSTPAGQAAPRKPATLSKEEQKHFSKLASTGGFGFNLLKKMGWSAGAGLGSGGEGMITPLESRLRPKAMGLAFEGFSERTKQAKLEEKRKKQAAGEVVSSDDEDVKGRPKRKGKDKQKASTGKGGEAEGPPAWKEKKPRKPKVQHMTYEEMVSGRDAAASPAGVGAIYDLSGRQLTTADLSHAATSHDVPSTDNRNLPELLHNLTMVSDFTKAEVDNLVREARISAERRKYLANEAARVRQSAKANLERESHISVGPCNVKDANLCNLPAGIARLQQLTKVATAIQQHSTSLAYDDRSIQEQIETFADLFSQLLNVATEDEYKQYKLDEVIVAALAPLLKRAWQEWDVLAEPTLYLTELKKWKKAFRCRQRRSDTSNAVGIFGSYSSAKPTSPLMTPLNEPKMTAFEMLLWTMWMPRVRSAINNVWQPTDPAPVLALYSSWQSSGLLPDFVSDNMLDQLILPKLKRAVSEWIPPRKGKSKSVKITLHHVLFPWLEYAGTRMDEVMDDAKRKVRGWLKTCKVRDGPPEGLEVWREVIQASEWDNLILQYIVPQLAAQLREDFVVNPREQDLTPLTSVLAWRKLLRDSTLSQILESEFFPKYLDTLHTWLSSPGVNFEQVAEWYTWWKKEVFGPLQSLPGVARGFETALDLMNQAVSLGEDAKYRLKKSQFTANAASSTSSNGNQSNKTGNTKQARIPAMDPNEVTFRAVVEEYAAENNLVFMPTGKSHEITGSPLFKISTGVDGKNGITIYLRGDVVYAVDKNGNSKPISVSEMVEQAKKKM